MLTIAATDPTNVVAIDNIKFRTGLNVELVVASEAVIADAIARSYGRSEPLEDLKRGPVEEDQEVELAPEEEEQPLQMAMKS